MKKLTSFLYVFLVFYCVVCFAEEATHKIANVIFPALSGYTFTSDESAAAFKDAKAEESPGYHLLGVYTNASDKVSIAVLKVEDLPEWITPTQWGHLQNNVKPVSPKANSQTEGTYRVVDKQLSSVKKDHDLTLENSIKIYQSDNPIAELLYTQTYVYLNGKVYVFNILSEKNGNENKIAALSRDIAKEMVSLNEPTKDVLIAIKMAEKKDQLRFVGMIALAIILFMMMTLPLRSGSQTIIQKEERKREVNEVKERQQEKLKANRFHGPVIVAALIGVLFFFISVPIIFIIVFVVLIFFLFRFLLGLLFCLAVLFVGLLIAGWAFQDELNSNQEQIYDIVTRVENSYSPDQEIQKIWHEKPRVWQLHLKPQSLPSVQYLLKQTKQ